jgi:hypothetical protein
VLALHCPKSIITAQSLYYLEQFRVWKQFGGENLWSMESKLAEALMVLDQVWQRENQSGEQEE